MAVQMDNRLLRWNDDDDIDARGMFEEKDSEASGTGRPLAVSRLLLLLLVPPGCALPALLCRHTCRMYVCMYMSLCKYDEIRPTPAII